MSKSVILTQEKFNNLLSAYNKKFNNAPKTLSQLTSFCKEYGINNEKYITYSQLKPFYYKYNIITQKKNSQKNIVNTNNNEGIIDDDMSSIDYEIYWNKYINLYNNKPKNAKQLFNYLKNDLNMNNIKYKDIRLAFNKLNIINNISNIIVDEINTDGDVITKNNDDCIKNKKNEIRLKIYHSTSDKVKNEIKNIFITVLDKYKSVYKCFPKNAWNLFNYINDETEYKVKYTDVQHIMKYAITNKWYTLDNDTSTTKDKPIKKETKKIDKIITKDEYNEIINEYKKEFNNIPKNAIQLMNYINDYMNKGYKYNIIRIAFNKYHKLIN